MDVDYRVAQPLAVEQFIDLLHRSGLAERRPVGDIACMQGMLDHADLCITAWRGEQLVGVARSVTDFHYCCYLSDLAVDLGPVNTNLIVVAGGHFSDQRGGRREV